MFRRLVSKSTTTAVQTRAASIAIGGYGLFMKQVYKNAAQKKILSKLSTGKRGKQIAQWYKALPALEKAKLAVAGAKAKVKRSKTNKFSKRKASKYTKFVKANMSKVKKLPVNKRLATLAKQYKASQVKK